MPYTPFHFGPSGFIALAFRKWIDPAVFVLANVIVDIEVLVLMLLEIEWPRHRHCHTLLIGAAVGIVWGLTAYLLRNILKKIMQIFHIPYKTGLRKMLISGVFGAWFHVIVDAVYHWDVQMFWPSNAKPLHALLTREQINIICTIFFIPAVILYILVVIAFVKKNRAETKVSENEGT
ncbi:MAG: hypothetical protein ACYS6W_16955 [Planctomycetota bacterium]|jgi:membrane-bound metal-dependent hydrolase YbcI (DUF457 family)